MKTTTIVAASMIALSSAMAQSPFSQGTNNLAKTNLANAYANFAAAASANPADPTNNIYYVMTGLLMLPALPAGSNFLNSVGAPSAGRDVYDWTAKPTNSSGKFLIVPGENANWATAQLRTNALAAFIAAQATLAQITDADFTLDLPGDITHFPDVTIDYGDVLMLRALLQSVEVLTYQLYAWNLDAQFSVVTNVLKNDVGFETILTNFPDVLTFDTTNDLAAEQDAFSNAANLYFAASAFIRARPTNETRLFNLSTNEAQSELEFRETLTNLVLSLNGTPQPLPTGTNYRVSMAAFFSGKTAPRSLFPQIQGNDFVWNSFPDPTLGGVVFGLTSNELNQAMVKKVNALLNAPNIAFTVLASFVTQDSANGVILGGDGNLYGTTLYGGTNFDGSVFSVSPSGTIATLYQFGSVVDVNFNPLDGSNPNSLIQGSDGNLYGTTQYGGANDWGSIFKITTAGKLTTLYSFGTLADANGNPLDGDTPFAALVQGADGNLYGTTSGESSGANGTVFKISTSGDFVSLYTFTGGDDGSNPSAPLVEANGNFFGTALYAGSNDFGAIFKISPAGALTPLYSFGANQDTNGNALDGESPNGLVLAADGNLYGTTQYGGANDLQEFNAFGEAGDGTVFRISTSGAFQSLVSFDQVGQDGYYPLGSLVQNTNGTLYGVTSAGGANELGTIFALDTSGALSSAFWFTADSGNGITFTSPGLTRGADGNFYGATISGGPTHNDAGTVYRIGNAQASVSATITIAVTGPSTAVISWPAALTGYTLEQNSALDTSKWTVVTNSVAVVGGQNQVTVTTRPGDNFFQLVKP